MKNNLLMVILFFLSLPVFSANITDDSFLGKWCGQWDGIYAVCVIITSIEENAVAQYEWVEKTGENFKQSNKAIIRVNRNTLKLDNLYFALDENNLSQANAMGVFTRQTRVALLKKINP